MERTLKLAACVATLLTLLLEGLAVTSPILLASKRSGHQGCPPFIASTSNHSTWLPVVDEGEEFHISQQYTTSGYDEDLYVAWACQPSSLHCSPFNITRVVTDIHTLNASIATRVDESCSDERIYRVFISSNCTFKDNNIFNVTSAKNDSCNKGVPLHPENPKSVATPESRPGTIGWPDLTEWLGGMNSPTIGAKLMYISTNFSRKFLNIKLNGSELIASLAHFANEYKVAITCESYESTMIQLYIPAEGRYKMSYNFTDDVQWTGQSTFPPEYEVPNCSQCIQAIPTTNSLLLKETIGGPLVLIFVILLAAPFARKIVRYYKRHPQLLGRDPDQQSLLKGSTSITYRSYDGGEALSHENITEHQCFITLQDQKKGCTGGGNSVTLLLDDQLQHMECDWAHEQGEEYTTEDDDSGQDQSLRATCTDMTDDQSCIQPLSTCYKDDGSTHIPETLSSSVDKGGDDSKGGDESDHSGNFSMPESRSSYQSTKQNVTKVAEIKDPQQEYSLLTEKQNLFLDLEAQDEVKSSLGIPHPFTTEGPDVTMGVGEVLRLSSNLKPQICSDDAGNQTLFSLPYERRPLPTVADQLNISFIDPIEILSCNTLGGFYNKHDVELMVPEGAVLPGEKVSIEFGVSMYGPFKIADGKSVKRVSPVVWLCIQQAGFTGFQKDVQLTIPHFLHISTEDASRHLRFLKSDHQLDKLDKGGEVEYQLRQADGRALFNHPTKCTLVTRHFCLLCITSKIQPDKHTKYCLIGGRPKTIVKGQDWEIVFFICYCLKLCKSTVKKQMQNDNMQQIQPTTFMFPDGSDKKLNIDISNAQGLQLALVTSNMISAEEVDFQSMTLEELQLREDRKRYPPRFVIGVCAATENSQATFTFQGAIKTIVKVVQIKGGEAIVQEATNACLDKRPKMNELFCIRDKQNRRIKLISTVQTKVTSLGLALRLEYSAIQSIEQGNHSQETSCTEILDHWLKGNGRIPVTWKTLLDALRDCAFMQLADDLEVALDEGVRNSVTTLLDDQWQHVERDLDKEYFKEAMKKGYVECTLTTCAVTGAAGTGKSHTIYLALNEDPPDIRQSTGIVEPVRALSSVVGASSSESGSLEWSRVDEDKLLDIVAGATLVTKAVQTSPSPPTTHSTSEETFSTHSMSEEAPSTSLPLATPQDVHTQEQPESPSEADISEHISKSDQASSHTEAIEERLTKLAVFLEKSQGKGQVTKLDFLYFLDSGGQPQFHELLPSFVPNLSAIVFVLKLSEELSQHPVIEYYKEGKPMCSYKSPYSHEQILKHCIRALQPEYCSIESGSSIATSPHIAVVGTYRDEESEGQIETRTNKNQKLRDLLEPRFWRSLIYYHHLKELIYPVNAKNPNQEDKATAGELRKAIIHNSAPKAKTIPLPWFILEQVLRKLAKERGTGIMHIDECRRIAHRLHIKPSAFDSALKYLVSLNVFLYYPKVLPDVVFCVPQLFLDKINELVEWRHILCGGHSTLLEDAVSITRGLSGRLWWRFQKYGLFQEKLLHEEAFSKHYDKAFFTPTDFLKLLEYRLIVGKVLVQKTDIPDIHTEYVMPSLLYELESDKLDEYRCNPQSSPAAPLLVHFPREWPTSGVFCSLVASLLSTENWEVMTNGRKEPTCLYRNCFQFRHPKMPGSITLIDSFDQGYFEVHVCDNARLEECTKYCPEIRQSVFSALPPKAPVNAEVAFFCPNSKRGTLCSTSLHLADINPCGYWSCSENPNVYDSLEKAPQMTVWGISTTSSSDVPPFTERREYSCQNPIAGDQWFDNAGRKLSNRPEVNQLMKLKGKEGRTVKVIEEVAAEWQKLAYTLKFSSAVVRMVECDTKSCSEACVEVLRRWMNEAEGARQPVSWATIIECLKDCDFKKLARDLEDVLCEH